jgi:hypothetical protein
MQQLTHLDLKTCLRAVSAPYRAETGRPPVAAYAALTASSKLQYLDISGACLPPGVWQHLFPADRQLPSLQFL